LLTATRGIGIRKTREVWKEAHGLIQGIEGHTSFGNVAAHEFDEAVHLLL
jgi:hypothetical protein